MKYTIWFILCVLVFVRYFTTKPVYQDGDRVRITSTIYSDPIKYESSQYLKIAGLKMYIPIYPEVFYGDKICVEGVVDNGKLKNAKLISRSKKIGTLQNFRNGIISFFQRNLPQPESGLLAGIILGSKGSLLKEFYEDTKATGVAHVVVASGTNISFVVSFLMSVVTLYLPRRKAIPFVILGIVLYLFVAGFDAPLIRAAIMSLALFIGQESGRMTVSLRIFALSALIMLVINPLWLIDAGFQLSFAATGSLILFEKRVERLLKFLPKIIKQDLATSLAAQIGVTPILFVLFRQFNILSPVINVAVLWTIAPVMIIGSVGGIAGLIYEPLGKVILWLSYPLLWWFVKIVAIFKF